MRTMKYIGLCAACMMSLLMVSVPAGATGNDWFEKQDNFYAYYDGMGNVYLDLLVWTYGSGHNHWAGTTSKGTYIEYTTSTATNLDTVKNWTKLFTYHGDNVKNKSEEKTATGAVWIKPERNDKGSLTVLNCISGLDMMVDMNSQKDQEFSLPHNYDERRSVSVYLKWSIPQGLEDSTLSIRLHLCDERTDNHWNYEYTLLTRQKIEKGEAPTLSDPVLYQGGTNKDAGKIMVPYVLMDEPESYTSPFNEKDPKRLTDPVGYILLPSSDTIYRNYYIKAKVKRLNGQPAEMKSNAVDILAYHRIDSFKVKAYCNYKKGGNTGGKVLTWHIERHEEKDIVPVDFIEIQRAYKKDFSDAKTIANQPFTGNTANYQYIDSAYESVNPDPKSDTVYYRIRRMSSSVWGWDHAYAGSAVSVEPIRQIGLDVYKNDQTPYAAFKDCSNDSINIAGQIVWPNTNAMRTVAWDPNTTLDVCLKDEQGTIVLKTFTLDSLRYNSNSGGMPMLEFSYRGQLPTTCQRYDLFVRLNAENIRFAKPQNTEAWFYPKRRMSAIKVLSVNATNSEEKHPAYTAINWKTDGIPDCFIIRRRLNNGQQTAFDSIDMVDGKQKYYFDTQAEPGVEYIYRVEAVTLCTGKRLATIKDAVGCRCRYGYIDGYLSYTNGDKVAGITVVLKDTLTNEEQQKTTNADGKFTFSKIKYDLDKGSTFAIRVEDQSLKFEPAAGGNGSAYVTLNKSVPSANNINFETDKYQRYSGRVLYTGTSIPVRDAYFLINNNVAKSGGDTIRSDASGNFTLSVPAGPNFTLTVAKQKHTFVNDGKLLNGEGGTSLNAQSGSQDAIRFWDNTRTRLIGRLAGGDIQGDKELGFGLSKNNLGDSLKLVFELEGDNIAHFVYDLKDLTKKTREDTIKHPTAGQQTRVHYEEKRVIIYPDSKTGEYMIDLPPVKYRIVEASANGYATLFSAGRTSETKDLTYSLDTIRKDHAGQQVWYHDTYSIIYHAPASVAVTQLQFGVPIEHYGEEVVEGYTLSNRRMDTVCYQKDGKWIQKFGYPVYISGLQYSFRINAREEYRYNNDRNSAPDLVPLGNNKYTIYNGLKSGTSIIRGGLDNLGNADIWLDVENMSFDGVEEQVLKHFDVSVEINGQDVHSEPMRAFVTGSRITGADAMQEIGANITVEDVLRDPPGTSSYAWLEKGTTYTTTYNIKNAFGFGLDMSLTLRNGANQSVGTVAAPSGTGTYNGTFIENASGSTKPLFAYMQGFSWNQTYNYSYTTTERIQTSSVANVMGADATVFIGHTMNAYAMNAETFNVVDAATLNMMKPAIEQGVAHVVKKDDLTGTALVVTQDLAFTLDREPVRFVYTQDHIVKQIIPQLMAQMASLLRIGSKEEMFKLAQETQDYVYWYKQDYDPQKDTVPYILVQPDPMPTNKPLVNKMMGYNSLIKQWIDILRTNEYCELYGTLPQNRVASYSVSGNTSVTRTETGSTGYNYSVEISEKPSTGGLDIIPSLLKKISSGDTLELKAITEMLKDGWHKKDGDTAQTVKLKTPVKSWEFNYKTSLYYNRGDTKGRNLSANRTIGFTLSQAEYGYIDVDVYRLTGMVDFNIDSTLTSWRNEAINSVTKTDIDTSGYECSDFIYLLRGGATRCEWIPERTTQFYRPGTLLDPPTIKLDEAHLEVDKHEVSGVAADGVAVFDLQIWNESEAAPGVANGPHNFTLKLLEGTNRNGAKASIDGLTLTGTGRNFFLNPGQIIHKKLEVRQGALALNYDSLKLCLISDCDTSNYAEQYISVHFLPASTPVRIATPDDKWVMNTNSPYDKQGYYLPVVIDGFDPDYANFDHIELQYKLSTQSENNWVTLCSYYVDSVYYKKASGNKQMFNKEAGRIDNIHFYGERDPMEQRYDLRAVSYCRYGTGYVTKASEPVSGIKDTRRPELFGKVTPANGILTQQDYINVPFSEPIAYNYLDEDNNFQVIGFKNKADYYNTPTLLFSGNGYAATKVSHNLTQSNFTIDLTVLQKTGAEKMTYFSTGKVDSDKEKGVEFGWTGTSFYAKIGNIITLSEQQKMPNAFTRVVMTYKKDSTNGRVTFYMGNVRLRSDSVYVSSDNCSAPLFFGADKNKSNNFQGRMTEARIWSKALTEEEITATNNTCLTGYERGLLAYYPMTEGYGKTAYDKAHGADADLENLTWNMPEGRALAVPDTAGVELASKWFNNSALADYTLIFSFKSNPLKPFSGDALLFGDKDAKIDANNKQIGIFMTQTGQIVLVADSVNRLVADGNYNDGAWHSLGLVVSRGFNYTHLYIDDKLKAQTDGQFFGVWAMGQTLLGRNFNGYFDELSIWEYAMPQSYLSRFNVWAPNGQELGLRCYLPFDQRIKNDANIYETHYSQYNAKLYYNNEKQEWSTKLDTVVITELDDKSTTQDVCPLIRNSEYENMRFSWTSRDNDLVINLKMPDAEINHKTIFFSLRDVEDLQGNRLLSPIAWSVYLDRNIIRWDEQNLWVEKSASPVDTVVYTTITNYSGETKPFVISGLPEWLTVDEPIGTLQPQEQRVLVFTISGDLNAGDYVVPITLTDEANLSDQMLINVRVNAVFPNWSIPNSFNLNMNLIGTVHLRDGARSTYVDTDTRDIVGAFYGNTCVGMQSITSKVGSTANLYLKVYGKADMDKKDISLRLWQASTGKTFELTNSSDPTDQPKWRIRFVPDTVYGSVQKPIDFYVADSRVQNIPVYTGWNWISFNVQPTDINSSFVNVGGFSSNDQIKVYKSEHKDAAVYTQGRWSNNIMLDYSNIYMMNVSSSMVLEVRGSVTGQAPELTFRHGWNNLPCLFDANTPVDAAMADYFNAAKDGDIITGYYQFAVFDNKQWVGSLESLIPGEGYMLYRQAKDDVTVHFYPSAPASAPRKKVESERGSESRTYSTAMPIVAALESNEVAIHLDNAVLRAYAHDELVGEAKAVDGMWFLLVHAKDNAELTFTVTDDKGEEQPASNVLNYGAFAPTGTVHNPYLIRFGESDLRKVMEHGILYIHRNGNTYNAQGSKL